MLTSTGRLRPSELTYPTLIARSFVSARSSCTLVRIVYWVAKSRAMATMLWVGSAKPGGRFDKLPGKAGAPALVGLSVVVNDLGSPFRRMASS